MPFYSFGLVKLPDDAHGHLAKALEFVQSSEMLVDLAESTQHVEHILTDLINIWL